MDIQKFQQKYEVVFSRPINGKTGDVDMDKDGKINLEHSECYDPGSRLGKWLHKPNIGEVHQEVVDRDIRVADFPLIKDKIAGGVVTHAELGQDLPIAYLVAGPDIGSTETKHKKMSAVVDSAVRSEKVVGCRGLDWGFTEDALVLFAPRGAAGLTPRQEDLLKNLNT